MLKQATTFLNQEILQLEHITRVSRRNSQKCRLTQRIRDPILRHQAEIVTSKRTTPNDSPHRETTSDLVGRLLAIDPGEKRIGVAISDELHISVRPLNALRHTNWKTLLSDVKELLDEFDAKGIVIGLPLSLDGSERNSAAAARQLAEKFSRSVNVPVFLQDERLTSREAEETLRAAGYSGIKLRNALDSEAAAIILRDFIGSPTNRVKVKP